MTRTNVTVQDDPVRRGRWHRPAGALAFKDRRSGYLPTLDGWRAIAILLVLVDHASRTLELPAGLQAALGIGPSGIGGLGVDIFFGISGFLICSKLLQEERAGGISLTSFYIRRAFRILPPFLLVLGVISALALAHVIELRRLEFLSCLFFFRNYLAEHQGNWVTGHFWSLAVEEHFYLLWPPLLVWAGPRRALRLGLAGAGLIALWRMVAFRFFAPGPTAFHRTDFRLDAILIGCVAALLVERYGPAMLRWMRPEITIAAAIGVCLCVWKQPRMALTIEPVLISLMLISTVLAPSGWISRLLEIGPLTWIGRLSYSLYLWQQLFLPDPRQRFLPWAQAYPANILLMFAFAAMSYYWLERPAIRIGHRLALRAATISYSRPAQ